MKTRFLKNERAITYWAIRLLLNPYKVEIMEIIQTIYDFIAILLL